MNVRAMGLFACGLVTLPLTYSSSEVLFPSHAWLVESASCAPLKLTGTLLTALGCQIHKEF